MAIRHLDIYRKDPRQALLEKQNIDADEQEFHTLKNNDQRVPPLL